MRRILQIRWPETIPNEDLWEQTRQKPKEIQIKTRKWRWIGHTLRKTEGAVEKQALDWNPKGARRRGHPRITWKRSIEEEIREENKI